MELLNVVALVVFLSVLTVAASMEVFSLFRFTAYLRSLPGRRPPAGPS